MECFDASKGFFARLEDLVRSKKSLLCVGLDPSHDTVDAATLACKKIIDETIDFAPVYKLNSAFFESYGPNGLAALQEITNFIHRTDALVILDVKRGDIQSTAQAYAKAAFLQFSADAVTLNPLLGFDSIEPFIRGYEEKGIFILCKTSNESAKEFQNIKSENGYFLYEEIALRIKTWPARNLGLVVGATDPMAIARIRKIEPRAWILAPGIGKQGGDLEHTILHGLRAESEGGLGILLSVSRAISEAISPQQVARDFRDQIAALASLK